MTNLSPKKKKILIGVAVAIVLGLAAATIYKPQSYEEYLAKKHGISLKKEEKEISGPQNAVESFLKSTVSQNPTDALVWLENPNNKSSSADIIMDFLEIQIPLSFNYKVKDVTFNDSTGLVVVDLITSTGALEKAISLKNIDGEWKLTEVESRNNNLFLFTDDTETLNISFPQDMFLENSTVDSGLLYISYNPNQSLQVMIFVTNQDISEMLSSFTNCAEGICSTENINGNSFETYKLTGESQGEYAHTVKTQKDGIFYTIVGITTSDEKIEPLKEIIGSLRI